MPPLSTLLGWAAATIAMLALATAPIGGTAELALGSAAGLAPSAG